MKILFFKKKTDMDASKIVKLLPSKKINIKKYIKKSKSIIYKLWII